MIPTSEEYNEMMQDAEIQGEQCNNDIAEQIAFEKKIKKLTKQALEIEKQLIEVKYYLEHFDTYSAKAKSHFLLKAAKELDNSFA